MPDDLSAFNDVECKNHNLPCQQFVWRGKGGWRGGGGGGELEAGKHALSSILLHTLPLIHAHTKPQATQATKYIISRQTLNVLLPGRLTYEEIVTR